MNLPSTLSARLREWWSSQSRAQRFTYFSGLAIMGSGLAFFLAYLITGGAWAGPTGFRKTTVFGFSVGMTLLSMAWLLSYFPFRPRLNALLMYGMSAAMIIEILVIDSQWLRGVPSHFNMSTPYNAILWAIMGATIAAFATTAITMTVLSFGKLQASPLMRLTIRVALLFFAYSQLTGQWIVMAGVGATIGADGTFVAEMLPGATVIGAAGNLKLPHAITLHSIQVIPLLGLLLEWSRLRLNPSRIWLTLGSLGFAGLTWLSIHQAINGLAPGDMSTGLAVFGTGSLLLLGVPFLVAAAVALARVRAQTRACPGAACARPATV